MSTQSTDKNGRVTPMNTVVREKAVRTAAPREKVERFTALHVACCPECGQDLGQPTAQQVPRIGVADHELRGELPTSGVPTYGWQCTAHNGYAVVCPYTNVGSEGPNDRLDRADWTGVLYRLADERAVWIAVPEQEVP